jgi:hypothetical protein
MKRRVAIGVGLSLILALPTAAGASHQGDSGPPRDFAVGGGTVGIESSDPLGAQHVSFGAAGGPTTFDHIDGTGGDPVTGHFAAVGEFVDPPSGSSDATRFQQEGPVTCLVVDENRAWLVYPVKQGTFDPLGEVNEDSEILISLQDNGSPEDGDPRDMIAFVVLPDEDPEHDPPSEQDDECATMQPPATAELEKGNFTIHEGS